MVVSPIQMKVWTNLFDPDTARNAHHGLRRVLEEHMRPEVFTDVHPFLQGSYRNSTSIHNDSDVDLVVPYDGICDYDFDSLSFNDQIRARTKVPRNLTGY